MKLDTLGKGVNTDKTDAAELVSRLDRYLAGNHKAFAVVRVPTPEEEQRRCVSRQREQLRATPAVRQNAPGFIVVATHTATAPARFTPLRCAGQSGQTNFNCRSLHH
jgi:transposase